VNGVIVRYEVHGFAGLHDLYFVPDRMLAAMLEGRFLPLPASVMATAYNGDQAVGVAPRWPKEAVRGSRDDVVNIIEKGWVLATKRLEAVALADLPIRDSKDLPEAVPQATIADVDGPLMPLMGIPNRANGKTAMAEQIAKLRSVWAQLDTRRKA
jgi:hypothetical protein